ncbi:hypothetical protein DPEC_G00105510 [Dallia pectoralis]|uniref:Uncharacterized protein n=1 Tax=Dallia pectoralis TaxID=75939 RepID=A0ACC2GXQ5_DALPE|nr:hypothetical protein DPEC_G00105510 [Dallia pectoralis]
MDKLHSFRVFLKERLMTTALEIFCAFEQMSVEFQEENNRMKSFLRIPTEIRFSGVDFLQYSPSEEKVPPEKHHWKQEWSSSLWQQDPGHKQIKEEQEELNQWLLESKDSILTPSCVKSEYEQEGTKQADINRLNSSQELPFRAFLMKYLTELAAADIFGPIEKTISKYQEENYQLCRMMRSFPEIKLARIDSLQFSLSELDVFPEQQNCDQDWSSSLGQEDPEPTHIKEEQEELRTSQEEELNQGLLDNKDSILTPPCVKSEYDQDDSSQSLVLPETQTVEKSESDFTPLNLQQSDTMTHPKGPDISSEPPDNPDHLSSLSPDMYRDLDGFDSWLPLDSGPPLRRQPSPCLHSDGLDCNVKGCESEDCSEEVPLPSSQEQYVLDSRLDSGDLNRPSCESKINLISEDCSEEVPLPSSQEQYVLDSQLDSGYLNRPSCESKVNLISEDCSEEVPLPSSQEQYVLDSQLDSGDLNRPSCESKINLISEDCSEEVPLPSSQEQYVLDSQLDSGYLNRPSSESKVNLISEDCSEEVPLPSSQEQYVLDSQLDSGYLNRPSCESKVNLISEDCSEEVPLPSSQEQYVLDSQLDSGYLNRPSCESKVNLISEDCSEEVPLPSSQEQYVLDSQLDSGDFNRPSCESKVNLIVQSVIPPNSNLDVELCLLSSSSGGTAEENVSSTPQFTKKNYCFVCRKPQSKISRHFQIHEKQEAEIALAFSLPMKSEQRRRLLEKLRKRGNHMHNVEVRSKNSGSLKVNRIPKVKLANQSYIHCLYCKGMYVRKDLWRHVRRCPSKTKSTTEATGRIKVLGLASLVDSPYHQQVSPDVWKMLGQMNQDEVASVVFSDLSILQIAQSLYKKHGKSPKRFEHIRQQLRDVGRLLLCLRKKSSIYSLEDAIKPAHFYEVVEAVKTVAGFNAETFSYQTPSLSLKLGYSLVKISDIIHHRALVSGDSLLVKSTQAFKALYTAEWAELVSSSALRAQYEAKVNKPSTLPFTEDVVLLSQHLEKTREQAFQSLSNESSPRDYVKLTKVALSQLIVFNSQRVGEVSNLLLKSFQDRDQSELHSDVAVGLSELEKSLCKTFSRVEMEGKRGRKVALLLTPKMIDTLKLLVDRREECGVGKENPYLFARPKCESPFRGEDCLRSFAGECGAKNPERLRSTALRKHVATSSQILNLQNNELDNLDNLLAQDITVYRELDRLPEATTQMAKISELLLATEKECLTNMKRKSLDDIEDVSKSRKILKRSAWNKTEVEAVMKHFSNHIIREQMATMLECKQCKDAEKPLLQMRSLQNIRDFERLMATALEIFCAFEQMSVEFQEENNRMKSFLRIPTEIRFSGVDFLQYSPSEEKVPPEKHHWKQEWSSSLWQQDPGHKQIKEEQEELNQWLLESKDSILTPSCVKSEYEQEGTKQADINRLNSSQELPFRAFLMKYLTELAAAEIFGSVEKTISKYQEENYQLCRMMRSFPEIKLARIDSLQFSLSELDVFPEQQNCDQDWSSSLGQEDPEPTQIKEEQEELRTSQEEELNQGLLDNKDSILTPPCVKSEYDQDDSSQSLVLPETQTVEKSESDFTPLNLQQSDTMTHPKGPDISSEPPDNPDHLSRLSPDMNSDQYGLEPGPPMRRPHCSKARVVLIKVHCCRDCGASFFLEANLQKHVNLFSNKSSECGFCKQQFNSRCKLKAHVQRCQVDQLCSSDRSVVSASTF